jgi:carbamoyltransferase
LIARASREDIAASVQTAVEEIVIEAISTLLKRKPARCLGVSGGLFANVLLNQKLAESLPIDELFVYPAMSDQGMAAGGALAFLLMRDGLRRWLDMRWRFDTLYYGRDHTARADRTFERAGAIRIDEGDVVAASVKCIRDGGVIGTYLGRMEYGPRALGARSILCAAVDRAVNDTLNKRLDRNEFMPFAPVVRAERAGDVFKLPFNLAHATHFMTATCSVQPQWSARIPAVVHVDGTARPQIVHRTQNPIYYDILASYEVQTGLPALINTSFNKHEEPIINTPEECASALADRLIDAVVTADAVWAMPRR